MANILVIDDDPDMVLAAKLCLESGGHKVESAGSPAEGLAAMKAKKPDLILLDVMMDSATFGFQLALKLRGPDAEPELAALRAILIRRQTASHSPTPLRFAPDESYLPVDDFVEIPFEPQALL